MEESVTISKTNASEALSTVSEKSVLFLFLHYASSIFLKLCNCMVTAAAPLLSLANDLPTS